MKVFSKKKYIEWHKKYGLDVSDEEVDTREDIWYNRCDGKEVNNKLEIIGEGGLDDNGETLYYGTMAEWCEEVEDVKVIIPKEVDTKKCLHCGIDQPMYCEDCYQSLLVENAALRRENHILKEREQLIDRMYKDHVIYGDLSHPHILAMREVSEDESGQHIPRLD